MSERPPISPRSPRAALEPEQVPPPPKRSERARNPFVIVGNAIITLVLVLMIGAGLVYYYGRQTIEAAGPLQDDKVVNIPSRAGMADIAEVLQREGVIDSNRWAFIGAVFAMKARSDLKPGEYNFQKNASLREVIATIVEGKVVQHSVTIPEGLTSEQILARLGENDIFAGGVREIPREGTLLPEVFKALEVSEQTYYRWRNQFGGMKADDVKRLKELEAENQRLKRIVADQVLENQALKEIAKGNF